MSEPEVSVGPLRRRHLRGVMHIERAVYPHPWTESLFQSELALPSSRIYLVARAGRTTVGYAGIMFAPDEAHVTTIAVHPDWQRRHVATRLLVALDAGAVERGYRALTLEVRVERAGRTGAVSPLRHDPRRCAPGLLLQPAGGRRDHVGPRHRLGGLRAPARRTGAARRAIGGCGVNILGIETSCDETAAAVVVDGRLIRSSVVSSQVDLHARFGGVVPEIASRARTSSW